MADIRIDRAQRAADVLNNSLVKEAFEVLDRELMEQLASTPADEEEKRKNIHMLLLAGRRFKGHFSSLVDSGKLATQQLDQLNDKRKLRLWG